MLSFWSHGNLKTYSFISSGRTWLACDIEHFSDKTIRDQKKYLFEISQRNLTPNEKNSCASYSCSNIKSDICVSDGSYFVFSEVVKDLIEKTYDDKYTAKNSHALNWNLEESQCLDVGVLNSCAIASNYHYYSSKDRKKFYEVRSQECRLLSISEADCNYDF